MEIRNSSVINESWVEGVVRLHGAGVLVGGGGV